MSSEFGGKVKVSIFGESHGEGIGVVIDGLPAGVPVQMDQIGVQLSRRAPGRDLTSTPRIEEDIPEILSGVFGDHTTGAPLCAVIRNHNTRSRDYEQFMRTPRPSHADFTSIIRYNGYNDMRGSGHFSGRLTAPLVFAGAICRSVLEQKGVFIGGHIHSVAGVFDTPFDPINTSSAELLALSSRYFSVINPKAEKSMRKAIEDARAEGDSVGGTVEIMVRGLPAGVGSPMFDGIENKLSQIIFGIPAVKGLEFGAGFDFAGMKGSEANDPFAYEGDKVITTKNNNGGVLGGISTGMPLVYRAVFKPTPSISLRQKTVDLRERKNTEMVIEGRHDPCIVPRALPVVENASAIALLNLVLG